VTQAGGGPPGVSLVTQGGVGGRCLRSAIARRTCRRSGGGRRASGAARDLGSWPQAMVILILVVSVIVVAALSIGLGRWLQRKGTAMEQHRDARPPDRPPEP